MSKITALTAREILDSRGNPTIEVRLSLGTVFAIASVPSGASTGVHEACELRDGDSARYGGLGVLKAVGNVEGEIVREVLNKELSQNELDAMLIKLDGTPNKGRLGANAILGVSLAFARAVATEKGIELYEHIGSLAGISDLRLPQPFFNIINGGKHSDSGLDIQEFMLVPVGFPSFHEKVRAGDEIIAALKKILVEKGYSVGVGDEGGFAPKLKTNEEALDLMLSAIKNAGYSTDNVKIALDVAASTLFKGQTYKLKLSGEKAMNSTEMIGWYGQLIEKYPIISIEDGLSEDDWEGFTAMTAKLGDSLYIVGDDLTVTNIARIKTAVEKKAINSVLIKLNQIGTLSETIEAVMMTKQAGWIPFVSHRSGETTDTFIADLAVGLSCECIKSGSLAREERVCKYNRLMEIEDTLSAGVTKKS
ncbi:MAG: phosphopyruvate hydratase [Candidatus Paceibacterota bacterium]